MKKVSKKRIVIRILDAARRTQCANTPCHKTLQCTPLMRRACIGEPNCGLTLRAGQEHALTGKAYTVLAVDNKKIDPQRIGKNIRQKLAFTDSATVNTAEYRLIFMEFVEQLDDVELSQGYFQNLWPPRSPDLTTPDFFPWGYLKDRVYATRPQTLDDLKHNITQEIQAIDNRVLQRVASNMERRVELCLCRMEDIFNICYREFGPYESQNETKSEELKPASQALVFMIRGLQTNYKQIIGYFLSYNSTPGDVPKDLRSEAIREVRTCGYFPKVVVSDQAASNTRMRNLLGCEVDKPFIEIDGEQL
ncbi:hypothetical protein ANN_06438 [Periplaneta americana]|uniref:Transposable element P transposase-like RNase H domain-containing protein n=1 Tax=Periplaneta americana TaxID=6978 RepID=A0ABQ8TDJ0_PERAM|nr:hypothetical protein ANN_06438 [Periplaneta americana]